MIKSTYSRVDIIKGKYEGYRGILQKDTMLNGRNYEGVYIRLIDGTHLFKYGEFTLACELCKHHVEGQECARGAVDSESCYEEDE